MSSWVCEMGKKKTGEKSVAVNLVANGIKTLMSVLFPLITFPYASRILGAEGIGKVNYLVFFVSSCVGNKYLCCARRGENKKWQAEIQSIFKRDVKNQCVNDIDYLYWILHFSLSSNS